MEIFKATCASCEREFDCDIALLSPSVTRLRCPWCGTHFDRADSPRISSGRRPGEAVGWEEATDSGGGRELVEFEAYRPPPRTGA